MSKYERERNKRKNQRASNGLLILASGFLISNLLNSCLNSGAIREVQTYNPQIEAELTSEFGDIEELYLDGKHGFIFDTPNQSEQHCKGEYEVDNEVARVSGQITCSQVTELGD